MSILCFLSSSPSYPLVQRKSNISPISITRKSWQGADGSTASNRTIPSLERSANSHQILPSDANGAFKSTKTKGSWDRTGKQNTYAQLREPSGTSRVLDFPSITNEKAVTTASSAYQGDWETMSRSPANRRVKQSSSKSIGLERYVSSPEAINSNIAFMNQETNLDYLDDNDPGPLNWLGNRYVLCTCNQSFAAGPFSAMDSHICLYMFVNLVSLIQSFYFVCLLRSPRTSNSIWSMPVVAKGGLSQKERRRQASNKTVNLQITVTFPVCQINVL